MGKQSKEEMNGNTHSKETVTDHFQIQIPKSYKAMFFLGVFVGTFLLRHQVSFCKMIWLRGTVWPLYLNSKPFLWNPKPKILPLYVSSVVFNF